MESWRERRNRLTPEQQSDFDILMTVHDYNLYRLVRGQLLLRGELTQDIKSSREQQAGLIMDELEAGRSIRSTFDDLPQLPLRRGEEPPEPMDIKAYPNFIYKPADDSEEAKAAAAARTQRANDACDDTVVALWNQVHGDPPKQIIPPLDEVPGGSGEERYNFQRYVMDLSTGDGLALEQASFYMHDPEYQRVTGYSRIVSVSESDGMEPRLAYQSQEERDNLDAYIVNKVVCRTNEYLHANGSYMSINQAMELHDILKPKSGENVEIAYRDMFNHRDENGAPVEGKVERFLREKGLAPQLEEGAADLAQVVREDPGMDLHRSVLPEYELLTRNNLVPVDTFGLDKSERETIVDGQRRQVDQYVADYSNVHMYITGDAELQLRKAGIEAQDRDAVRAAVPFTISSNDMLVRERGGTQQLLHFDAREGRLVNIQGDTEMLSRQAVANSQPSRENMSIGDYRTMADKVGYSDLRQYLTAQQASVLDVQLRDMTPVQQELQLRSMRNAERILEVLEARGYEYELTADQRPGQIKAVLKEPRMDIRIADPENPHMVGRIYADNLETTIQPADRIHTSTVMKRIPALDQPAPEVVVSQDNPQLFARYKGSMAGGRPQHVYDVCYMPTPDEVEMALRSRLGIKTEFEDRNLSVGARQKFIGPEGELYRSKGTKLLNAAYHSSSNDMQVINMATGVKVSGANNRVNTADVPVCISTKYASSARITNPDAERSLEALYQAIDSASDHMKERVFGQIDQIASDTVPNYEKKEWVSYVRDPDDPSKPKLDENGEPVVWRRSKRNPELLENAGRERGDYGTVERSDDPTVRALQETYITYMSADDAILREVGESKEEYSQRIHDAVEKRMQDEELADDPAIKKLVDSFGFMDETVASPEEKLAKVQQHYAEMSREMFGYYDEQADELVINAGGVMKYGGVAGETELCRLIQEAQKEYNVRIIGADDTTVERIREKTISFNPETARDIANYNSEELSPFMRHVSKSISDSITSSGCTLDELKIDDRGVIQYKATRDTDRTGGKSEQITGQIGQVFEPDERGVYVTKYNNDSNRAILPQYRAYVIPDGGSGASLEARTRCISMEDDLCNMAAQTVRTQLAKAVVDNYPDGRQTEPLDTTALNRIYRSNNGEKRGVNYMDEIRATHGDIAEAYVHTMVHSIRYDTSFMENASMLHEMTEKKKIAERGGFADDRCNDEYVKAGRRIGDVGNSEGGYFDLYATSGARGQGLVRYLAEGAEVQPDGSIKPNPGSTKCALMNTYAMRYADYNPFDRNQMAFSNLKDSQGVINDVYMAHITGLDGLTMDDAYVTSKDFAERHLILTDRPGASEALTAEIIEKNLHEEPKFDIETGKTYATLRGIRFEIDPESDVRIGEQLKQRLIEQNIGMRPLEEGDKFCDPNGNKGVISRVIDPNMSDEEAEKRGIPNAVKLFRENEKLEVVGSAVTAVSRFNGGSIRSMMENPEPLKLPNGEIVQGGMGHMPLIISNNTVDKKSHIYDEEVGDNGDGPSHSGKGRAASSQLAWTMQSQKCDKLMEYCYGQNESALRAVREKLIITGIDFDENYKFHFGYQPHTLSNGQQEQREHIKIDTDLIELQTQTFTNGTMRYKPGPSAKAAADDAIETMMSRGGMLELPFPVKMATGQETPFDKESGKYLLPVLPIEYRMDKSFETDGTVSSQNYNRYYRDIIREAARFETEAKIQANAGGEVQVDIEASKRNQAAAIRNAQKSYDEMASGVIEREFEGKYNVWKSKVMSHRMEQSATLVITPDSKLDLDVVEVSRKTAEAMGLAEGDLAMFWRDPELRSEGAMAAVVKITDENIYNLRMNPANDKRFDGDYDGDSVGMFGTNSMNVVDRTRLNQLIEQTMHPEPEHDHNRYLREPEERLGDVNEFIAKYQSDRAFAREAREAYAKICEADNEARVARGQEAVDATPLGKDHMWDKLRQDSEMQAELGKLTLPNHMEDRCTTPIRTKNPDEVELALNTGLDVAWGANALRESGDTRYDEKMAAAREAWTRGDKYECYRLANEACHDALSQNKAFLCMDYTSGQTVFAGMAKGIESGAKGKPEALQNVADYVAGRVAYIQDENGKLKVDPKNCEIYQGVMATPWTKSEVGTLPKTENGEDFTPQQANEWLARQERLYELHKGSANCTCIKAEYTGLYGAHAQRMAATLRGREDEMGLQVMDIALQATYCGTQANLQSKHNVMEAIERCGNADALAALMRGQAIRRSETGTGWEVVKTEEGYFKRLNKEEWAATTKDFFADKHGLNVGIASKNIDYIAEALYQGPVDRNGQKTMLTNKGKDSCACTLDRLAYGGGWPELMKSAAEERELFNTKAAANFRPKEPIARETMKVLTANMAEAGAQAFSAEQAAARRAEREAAREAERLAREAGVSAPVKKDPEAVIQQASNTATEAARNAQVAAAAVENDKQAS